MGETLRRLIPIFAALFAVAGIITLGWMMLDYVASDRPRAVGACSVQCEPYKPDVTLSLECYCDTTRSLP